MQSAAETNSLKQTASLNPKKLQTFRHCQCISFFINFLGARPFCKIICVSVNNVLYTDKDQLYLDKNFSCTHRIFNYNTMVAPVRPTECYPYSRLQ